MNRRNFIGSATLVPATALLGAAQQQAHQAPPPATRLRMTVLKRVLLEEFKQYHDREITICTAVKDGAQFSFEYPNAAKPEGICGWAWDDLQKSFHGMATSGRKRMVACCSDGFRPVYFLIEKAV